MFNSKRTSIHDCSVIPLSKIENRAGNITPIENNKDLPFEIKRIYYLYDVPGGETRGGHAHRKLKQLIVAVSGSFDVHLEDGRNKKLVSLNRPNVGLLVIPGLWRELCNFSSGSICLVLASEFYDESDYIRNYSDFLEFKNEKQ